MTSTKPQIQSFLPYRCSTAIKYILQIKYPKYFSGKFHPVFYETYVPGNKKYHYKVTKSLKRGKACSYQFTPYTTKTYELYYSRNYRSSQTISWIDFEDYKQISKLSIYQKKALKNYFTTQTDIVDLTIELDDYCKDIYNLLESWFKSLKKLRSLQIYNFSFETEVSMIWFKPLLKIVSPMLQQLQLYGSSSYPIQLTKEINSLKNLQKLDIQADLLYLDDYDSTGFSELSLGQITQFNCHTKFEDPIILLDLLPKLEKCQELSLNLNFSDPIDQNLMDKLYSLIPKRLKFLKLGTENGKISTNMQYDLLSQIIVEDKFILKDWLPTQTLNYTKIFENKFNVSQLELSVKGGLSLKNLSKSLLQFTKLQIFKFEQQGSFGGRDWPLELLEFFRLIALNELSMSFSDDYTDIQQVCQIMQVCILKSQNIREICIRQSFSKSEMIPLVQFFLNQEKKNYFVALQQIYCPQSSLNQYYKYQYRRLRWELK